MRRVARVAATCLLIATSLAAAEPAPVPTPLGDATVDQRFVFPRDHGAHPDFRTEWWYVTGWLKTEDGDELGFQVTFFRSRLGTDERNPSRFAAKQILFAHAAVADPKVGHLEHDQRIARAGFGIAETSQTDADVTLEGWSFRRVAPVAASARSFVETGAETDAGTDALHFTTRIDADRFALDLDLRATQPVLEEGADAARPGYSQKGPAARDASRYYSVPQLTVTGTVARGPGRPRRDVRVTGTAWLDREWSSAYLDPQASGWDWVGLDFDDGSALMAFRMRDRQGGKLWAGGTRRDAAGRVERYAPEDLDFATLREWTSPRSRATWPVSQRITIAKADASSARVVSPLTIVVDPMMDDQELDSRASTGTIYWEGAVRVLKGPAAGDATGDIARPAIGKGYLELTGYFRPIRF